MAVITCKITKNNLPTLSMLSPGGGVLRQVHSMAFGLPPRVGRDGARAARHARLILILNTLPAYAICHCIVLYPPIPNNGYCGMEEVNRDGRYHVVILLPTAEYLLYLLRSRSPVVVTW